MIARLLLANVLVLATGTGLLPLLGVARTPRELLARSGLAYVVGLAAVGILAAVVAIAGAGSSWLLLALAAAASLATGATRLRGPPPRPRRPSAAGAAATAAVAALLVLAGLAFAVAPLVRFDSWFIWALKAKAIDDLGGAPGSVFGNAGVFVPHLEYPLLFPALESLGFRVMGAQDVQAIHLQFLLFAPAALTGVWALLRDRAPAALLWPALLALAAAPGVLGELLTGYADVPLAAFFCVAAVAAGRFLLTGERWCLAVAALLFGASAWTKNEGSLYVAAAYVALLAVSGRRRALPVVAAAAGTVVLALPWRIFTAVHGLHAEDYRFSDSLRVGYVADRAGRGPIALRAELASLFSPSQWALLVPLALAACALALALRRRRLALYTLGSGVLAVAGLTWIYVISPLGLPDYLAVTTDRVLAAPVLAAAALAPLVAADALAARRP